MNEILIYVHFSYKSQSVNNKIILLDEYELKLYKPSAEHLQKQGGLPFP